MSSDRKLMAGALAAVVAMGGLLLGSCSRGEHLRPNHGVQTRMYFDRQAQAAADGTGGGLDSEEAALIHESYRETLGQRRSRTRDQRPSMLILENGRAGQSQR